MGVGMFSPRLALPVLPILLAGGCVAAPKPAAPAPTTVPAPAPAPAPVAPAPDWQDRTLTAGGWRYERAAAGGSAGFGAGTATLSCRRATRTVALTVPGATGAVTVRATSATRRIAVASDGSMTLAANDPLLDAIAFSRGRFTIEVEGRVPLVLPAHAEIGRVIEDCRG